jgi:Y4dM
VMTHTGERFTLPLVGQESTLGNWIVKTPSQSHPFVPENEYSMMRLAELAKIEIPPIKLTPISSLTGIADTTIFNDDMVDIYNPPLAYAIRRFDRQTLADGSVRRVHSEDFAQILVKYPHEKYNGGNYASLAKILYQFSEHGLSDVNQLARRILVNILIANGDAHLKNWSVIYKDGINPVLSSAYDLVSTKVYLPNETSFSLNLDSTKHWYQVNMAHFEHWAKKADVPWRSVKPQLIEVMQIARDTWKGALDDLPMAQIHKEILTKHWAMLDNDFRVV